MSKEKKYKYLSNELRLKSGCSNGKWPKCIEPFSNCNYDKLFSFIVILIKRKFLSIISATNIDLGY